MEQAAALLGLLVFLLGSLAFRCGLRRAFVRDALTGLPGRAAVQRYLSKAMERPPPAAGPRVTLLLLDVDRFKVVNDAHGPEFGDRLLREIGARLAASVDGGGFVGRMSGDQFAVVLCAAAAEAMGAARTLLPTLSKPYEIEGHRVAHTVSIGVAAAPGDGIHAASLIQRAGLALSAAKRSGGDRAQAFLPTMQEAALRRLQIEACVCGAVERGEFTLEYQPRFRIASGAAVGFEALLRWRHPALGMLGPGEFIDVLEETGAIGAIGEWVFRSVCRQVVRWQHQGLAALPVAVNLSAGQFRDPGLALALANIISETGVDARLVEIEITESSLMHDPEEAAGTLRQLEGFGIKLSVDDFGTGYSSLAYLKRFPLDALKIDRAFVRDAPSDPDDAAIAKAIIQLAHTLGLRVVAEGVETAEQREFLRAFGCDEAQGFLYERPMSPGRAAALLAPCDLSRNSAAPPLGH